LDLNEKLTNAMLRQQAAVDTYNAAQQIFDKALRDAPDKKQLEVGCRDGSFFSFTPPVLIALPCPNS
jgi:hypothetical protein